MCGLLVAGVAVLVYPDPKDTTRVAEPKPPAENVETTKPKTKGREYRRVGNITFGPKPPRKVPKWRESPIGGWSLLDEHEKPDPVAFEREMEKLNPWLRKEFTALLERHAAAEAAYLEHDRERLAASGEARLKIQRDWAQADREHVGSLRKRMKQLLFEKIHFHPTADQFERVRKIALEDASKLTLEDYPVVTELCAQVAVQIGRKKDTLVTWNSLFDARNRIEEELRKDWPRWSSYWNQYGRSREYLERKIGREPRDIR